jgi:hypothetical protein
VTEHHRASNDVEVVRAIEGAIERNGDVLVFARLPRGSVKQWHLVGDRRQLEELLAGSPAKSSLIVFLAPELPIRGEVNEAFKAGLADLAASHPELFIAVRDSGRSLLVDGGPFEPVDERGWKRLNAWLDRHDGEMGVAGPFPPLFSAADASVLEVVVPDAQGRLTHDLF